MADVDELGVNYVVLASAVLTVIPAMMDAATVWLQQAEKCTFCRPEGKKCGHARKASRELHGGRRGRSSKPGTDGTDSEFPANHAGNSCQSRLSPSVSNSEDAAATAAPSSTAVMARMRIWSLLGSVSVFAPAGTSKA